MTDSDRIATLVAQAQSFSENSNRLLLELAAAADARIATLTAERKAAEERALASEADARCVAKLWGTACRERDVAQELAERRAHENNVVGFDCARAAAELQRARDAAVIEERTRIQRILLARRRYAIAEYDRGDGNHWLGRGDEVRVIWEAVDPTAGPIDVARACTGVSAGWCPVHGDCTCPNREQAMDSPDCPLHGRRSDHAEEADPGNASYSQGHRDGAARVREEWAATHDQRAAELREHADSHLCGVSPGYSEAKSLEGEADEEAAMAAAIRALPLPEHEVK